MFRQNFQAGRINRRRNLSLRKKGKETTGRHEGSASQTQRKLKSKTYTVKERLTAPGKMQTNRNRLNQVTRASGTSLS